MKKQQIFLIELDADQLRDFCSRLPLEETDQKIAYALASLCAATGSYVPERGVGQKEIAQLAGVGVRTVKRRLDYLVRYGILSVERLNGRSNCYHFDLGMMIQAPAPTHNLYKYIKSKPPKQPPRSVTKTNDRQRLLFDETDENTTVRNLEEISLLSRMTGAVFEIAKRMFTAKADVNRGQTGDTGPQTGANVPNAPAEPGPNRGHAVGADSRTGANVDFENREPGPTEIFGAETGAIPGPTAEQSSGEPGPNRGQTGATRSTLHKHNTYHSEPLIKNNIEHVHVGSDSEFSEARGAPSDAWCLPPRTTKPKNSELPLGERKVCWGRNLRDSDLKDPHTLQELYEIAVDQGFFLESQVFRREFFALAHYVSQQKGIRSKVGLFSSLVDQTYDNKLGCSWQQNITDADDDWASNAIDKANLPPI